MPAKKSAPSFESALDRIEQIATLMENGELPLEELIVIYEEGLGLFRFCSERLEAAEKRLQTITRDSAGRPQGLEPVRNPGEIPPSTPPETSGTEGDSTGAGAPGARLF